MKKQSTQHVSEERQINVKDTANTSNKNKILAISFILILLIVLGIVIAVVLNLNKEGDNKISPQKKNTVITIDNKEEILSDLSNKVMEGLFEVKMNVDWSFKDSSTPSENAYVANVTTNTNTVYFDVVLDGTGETVYRSPNIPVGSELKNITLEAELAAGTYNTTLTYHLIDDDNNEVSTMAMGVILRILN